jgi:hypothetical protein
LLLHPPCFFRQLFLLLIFDILLFLLNFRQRLAGHLWTENFINVNSVRHCEVFTKILSIKTSEKTKPGFYFAFSLHTYILHAYVLVARRSGHLIHLRNWRPGFESRQGICVKNSNVLCVIDFTCMCIYLVTTDHWHTRINLLVRNASLRRWYK